MGWLEDKILKSRVESHQREMLVFIAELKTMSDEELGLVAAAAAHVGAELAAAGLDITDPPAYFQTHPTVLVELNEYIRRLLRRTLRAEATGAGVWLNTFRAGVGKECRTLANAMWHELSRGFSHIESAQATYGRQTGRWLNIAGAAQFPVSLASLTSDEG